jgi:hypothetical protein
MMMRKWIAAMGLALLLVGGCREGDTFDSLVKSRIKLVEKKAKILEDVKDRQTAEEARPKLEEVNQQLKEIDERRTRLGKKKGQDAAFTAAFKAEKDNATEVLRVVRRLERAREKVLANEDAAKVLKGINLE